MSRRHILAPLAAAMIALAAAPAAAQFSESYNFLKAVRDADGEKVTKALQGSGVTIINTRDYTSGETGLHIVTKRRDLNWVAFLLSKGANPNSRDNAGNTPLMLAAQLNFIEGVNMLIAGKAAVNQANNSGETALIMAVQQRNPTLVRLLLSNGADPKLADRIAGKSARDYAVDDPRAAAILKIIDEPRAAPAAKPRMSGPGL